MAASAPVARRRKHQDPTLAELIRDYTHRKGWLDQDLIEAVRAVPGCEKFSSIAINRYVRHAHRPQEHHWEAIVKVLGIPTVDAVIAYHNWEKHQPGSPLPATGDRKARPLSRPQQLAREVRARRTPPPTPGNGQSATKKPATGQPPAERKRRSA